MRFNPRIKHDLEKYKEHVIIVEGKKDVATLNILGFEKVHAIHNTGTPLRERVEMIVRDIGRKERVCILTDFDKRGKQLYLFLKPIFQEHGVRLDSRLRVILFRMGISHIEGLDEFMRKSENLY